MKTVATILASCAMLAGAEAQVSKKTDAAASVASAATSMPVGPPKERAPLDLNTASEAELRKLDGMSQVHVRDIVEGRKNNRRYHSVEDLLTRRIVNSAEFDRIKKHVFVSPAASAPR